MAAVDIRDDEDVLVDHFFKSAINQVNITVSKSGTQATPVVISYMDILPC